MARKKFKMTGFARFFLVMLILAPASYIGASYANGEDGIENFKNLFSGLFNDSPSETESTKQMEKVPENSGSDTASAKDAKIQELQERNEVLKESLEQKTKEVEDLKAKIESLSNPG